MPTLCKERPRVNTRNGGADTIFMLTLHLLESHIGWAVGSRYLVFILATSSYPRTNPSAINPLSLRL